VGRPVCRYTKGDQQHASDDGSIGHAEYGYTCHQGDNIKPIKERNENKIDAVVALIMAIGRSMTTPATQQSIYNESCYL